jgi:hypothetical protein
MKDKTLEDIKNYNFILIYHSRRSVDLIDYISFN